MQVWFLCFDVLSSESALCSSFCLVSVQVSEISSVVGNMRIQPGCHLYGISDFRCAAVHCASSPFVKDDNFEMKMPCAYIYMHVKRLIKLKC